MPSNKPDNSRQGNKGVEVEIFGQKYVIRGDEDEAYIHQLAAYVDTKMREMHGRLHLATPAKVAVLAAFNIAHELLNIKKEMEDHDSVLAEKADKLLELISLEFKT